jgi:hypothetical protein
MRRSSGIGVNLLRLLMDLQEFYRRPAGSFVCRMPYLLAADHSELARRLASK